MTSSTPVAAHASVVSIWRDSISTDKPENFLGCGAFITPRLVLTAEHVVAESLKAAEFCLGSVPDYTAVRFESSAIQRCLELDIALIDLQQKYSVQPLPLDFRDDNLSGHLADIHGFNKQSLGREVWREKSIGSLHQAKGEYLFDTRVLKGFSGGFAILNEKAIGIIIERHETDLQTVVLPLHKTRQWLQKIISDETLAQYFPVSPPKDQKRDEQAQAEFFRQVRQGIANKLQSDKFGILRDELLKGQPVGTKPEEALIPSSEKISVESSIRQLHHAVRACLETLTEQALSGLDRNKRNKTRLNEIKNSAPDVLGWLVLMTVREEWVNQGLNPADMANMQRLQIPIATDTGIEVFNARLRGHRAEFKLADGVWVRGKSRLNMGALEVGLNPSNSTKVDPLQEIKQLICMAIHKKVAPNLIAQLSYTLEKRLEDGESYYLIVSSDELSVLATDVALRKRLRTELPHLGIFVRSGKMDGQVFVILEDHLEVLVREFLRMLDKFQ